MKRSGMARFPKVLALAALAFAFFHSAQAFVQTIPPRGFAGATVVREDQRVLVKDAAGRTFLMLRARPFSNRDLVRHLKVAVTDEAVTIDAHDAFAAGAVDIPIDPEPAWARTNVVGRDCLFLADWSGQGAALRWDVTGVRQDRAKGAWRKSVNLSLRPTRHTFENGQRVPADLKYVGNFVLLKSPGKGPVSFYGLKGGPREEVETPREPYGEPKLMFRADFDRPDLTADRAGGEAAPVRAEGVDFEPSGGRLGGGAVRFSSAAKSALAYRVPGNVRPSCGSVAFWAKASDASISNKKTRTVFALPAKDGRAGAGDVELGWDGNRIRARRGDFAKTDHVRWGYEPTPGWHHYVFVWSDTNKRLESFFIDGQSVPPGRVDVANRPTGEEISNRVVLDIDRRAGDFPLFYIGSLDGEHVFDGVIDDVRVYSAPLDVYAARRLFDREREAALTLSRTFATEGSPCEVRVTARLHPSVAAAKPVYAVYAADGREVLHAPGPTLTLDLPAGDYAVGLVGHDAEPLSRAPFWVLRPGNPRVLKPGPVAGVPGRRRLVAEWRAGEKTPAEMTRAKTFRSVGACRFGSLDGRTYLETGAEPNDRLALRFRLDASKPLHCFEFDYPDDKARVGEIIIEPCRRPADHYEMQCGFACGGEFALTGGMLTHRVLYWTVADDVVAVLRSLHGMPAALSAVRVYELEDGGVPAAAIPAAPGKTPRRSFAYYSEDTPINACFGSDQTSAARFDELFNRLAAVMKYVGQDTLAYPGVWYDGIIEGTGGVFNPHEHAKDFLQGVFEKFDREGLGFIPLEHRLGSPYPQRLVTRERMRDGSLHDSPVAIFDTGLPNWGGHHFSCSDFNIQHPSVQRRYFDDIDFLIAQGRDHPSFRGVGFHLAKYSPGWYGGLESGYNDYSVAAFEKATGVAVRAGVGAEAASGPLRGKAYAAWIRANCLEAWIDWRCEVLAEFYAKIAARLRAARPDLKLWLNCWPMFFEYPTRPDWASPDLASRMFREYGIDGAKLRAKIPNLVLGTQDIPMWSRDEWPGLPYPEPAKLRARDIAETADFYAQAVKGGCPAVAHFDSYFESAVGATHGSHVLTCDWMTELGWRVAALNPAGRNVLARYAIPLKFADVQLFSKGGFLCGLYGTEEVLAPWMQNFRALPAVPFADVTSPNPDVTIRRGEADGRTYFYAVNTTAKPQALTHAFPPGSVDVVSGRPAAASRTLAPYELVTVSICPSARDKGRASDQK